MDNYPITDENKPNNSIHDVQIALKEPLTNEESPQAPSFKRPHDDDLFDGELSDPLDVPSSPLTSLGSEFDERSSEFEEFDEGIVARKRRRGNERVFQAFFAFLL